MSQTSSSTDSTVVVIGAPPSIAQRYPRESMMRRVAGRGLTIAAIVLSLVALLVNAPGLFYMSTAIIVTILAGRVQAWISVQWLRVERIAPSEAHVGEMITVETIVWSERKIRRPLVSVDDDLPKGMVVAGKSPSLPIAPAFDKPIKSQYRFRPLRRGRYSWSGVNVVGIDALGITSISKRYATESTVLLVVPSPIALTLDSPPAGGLGISEAGSGQARGGLEPRGIREFAPGDSIRHVHWRSSARTGTLLVKEFEAGSQALFGLLMQRSQGSDFGRAPLSSLDLMCGHFLYLTQELGRGGAESVFPQLENGANRDRTSARIGEVETLLADIHADSQQVIGNDLLRAAEDPASGSVFYLAITQLDPTLPSAIAQVVRRGRPVTVLIYDPAHFVSHRKAQNSAIDPAYIDSLTAAGARTIIVPLERYSGGVNGP